MARAKQGKHISITKMFMLLMLVGLLIIQVGIFLITMQYRTRDQEGLALAENARISMSFYRLFVSLPPDIRIKLADDLSFPVYIVEIRDEPGIVQSATWQSQRLATHTTFLLNRYEQLDDFQHEVGDFTPKVITNIEKISLNWRVTLDDYLQLRGDDPRSDFFANVAISLPGSQWLVITFSRMFFLDNNLFGMIMELTLQLVLQLALAYLVLRLVTRSMRQLTAYADKIDAGNLEFPPDATPQKGPTEVRRMSEAYADLLDRVQQSVDERMKVLASLSHDLRNPVHRLRAQIENDTSIANPEPLLETVDDLQQMAENAIDMARTGRNDEPFYVTDIRSLLENIVFSHEDRAAMQNIAPPRIVLHAGNSALCSIRPSSFQRCLENLVDNALRYGEQADIFMDDLGDSVRIRIEDRGPGIPEHNLENVFQAFLRLEPSRNSKTGGAGLGLSIARTLARQNNTDILLENMPEGGLRASIILAKTMV